MDKSSLGDRMKGYETVARGRLIRRTPVIIRVDGKAFHTLTRGMKKPFDYDLVIAMWDTARALCSGIQGAKVAYTQSDEISVLLTDFETIKTDSWFDYEVQKMASVSASIATLAFTKSLGKDALFDSRVFNIPREEVVNYFLWRQQDATRNSIQMVAQANFPHRQLQGLSCDQLQEKLFQEKGINWNDLPVTEKRGACAVKETYPKGEATRTRWVVDETIPVFSQDRNYIGKYLELTVE